MSHNILVIDDNPKIKASLSFAFPEYKFISVSSGEEGLRYLRKPHDIDLVILDYKMQGMDGMETLRQLRQLETKLGVMILTSFGSKALVVEALKGHADDFIDKPFNVEEMRKKLEEFFETHGRKDSGPSNALMQRMLRFIHRNYAKSPTLEDIAAHVSLSPKYVSRKFRQEMLQTYSQYTIGLRMERAKKLLCETSQGVAQVAYEVGYENAESFIKMFKKFCDCTPTEYRKKTPDNA